MSQNCILALKFIMVVQVLSCRNFLDKRYVMFLSSLSRTKSPKKSPKKEEEVEPKKSPKKSPKSSGEKDLPKTPKVNPFAAMMGKSPAASSASPTSSGKYFLKHDKLASASSKDEEFTVAFLSIKIEPSEFGLTITLAHS